MEFRQVKQLAKITEPLVSQCPPLTHVMRNHSILRATISKLTHIGAFLEKEFFLP